MKHIEIGEKEQTTHKDRKGKSIPIIRGTLFFKPLFWLIHGFTSRIDLAETYMYNFASTRATSLLTLVANQTKLRVKTVQ